MMSLHEHLRPARHAIAALTLTLATLGGVATATTGPAEAVTASSVALAPAMATGSYEKQVQYWVNVRRAHHGLRKLRVASCIDRVAERWGEHLATTDTFYHQSMTAVLDRCDARYAGETLGRGAISPKRLVYLWMHSPEHRHVLLSKYPRRIGIGAYPDRYGEWVVAADFMRG